MSIVRFFWIGEESEIFAAESIQQLVETDNHRVGTGVERHEIDSDGAVRLYEYGGDEMEWGEHDGCEVRMTVRDCDEDEHPRSLLTGNLHDIYAWIDGGRFGLPAMLLTSYN